MPQGRWREVRDRAGARADINRAGPSGGAMDSVDLLGADSADAGLHGVAQLPRLACEVAPAAAALGIGRVRRADEFVVPDCALWFRIARRETYHHAPMRNPEPQIRRADEFVVPDCALGRDGKFPDAGVHGICAEVS